MAKRQGHGRKNQKPTDAWSMDGCRAFWRYKTNKEKNESRRIIVKASTKKKTSDPCQFEVGACPRRCIQTCLAVKVKIQPCLESDRIFFGCLVTHGLSSKKEATLRTSCWLFFSSRFDHLATNLPLKENTFGFKKKGAKPAHLFLFTHVPCPSKQWNPGSDTAIGLFFLPILWSGIAWCPRSG